MNGYRDQSPRPSLARGERRRAAALATGHLAVRRSARGARLFAGG